MNLVTEPDWAPTNYAQLADRVDGRRLALLLTEQDSTEGPCDPAWFCLRERKRPCAIGRDGLVVSYADGQLVELGRALTREGAHAIVRLHDGVVVEGWDALEAFEREGDA